MQPLMLQQVITSREIHNVGMKIPIMNKTTSNRADNHIYAFAQHYVLQKGKEGEPDYFLFDLRNGKMFQLNKTSYAMLEAFNGERRLSEVVSLLANRFSTDSTVIHNDLMIMISAWLVKGILISKDSMT